MGKFVLAAILLQNIFCSVFFCSSLETTPERLDISVTSGLIEKQEQMVEKRLGICKCSYESIRKGGEKHKNSSIDWLQYGRYTHRHTIRKAPTRVILSATKNLRSPLCQDGSLRFFAALRMIWVWGLVFHGMVGQKIILAIYELKQEIVEE